MKYYQVVIDKWLVDSYTAATYFRKPVDIDWKYCLVRGGGGQQGGWYRRASTGNSGWDQIEEIQVPISLLTVARRYE